MHKKLDLFFLCVPKEILNLIIRDTNEFKTKSINRREKKPTSLNKSKLTFSIFIKALAMHFIFRADPRKHIKEYWEKKEDWWLSHTLYMHIMANLDCDLSVLSVQLSNHWSNVFQPSPGMAVDETIFGFKGKCPVKRILPRKPGTHNQGIDYC